MQYIDKHTNKAAGNQVTLDYLNTHCKDASGHYSNIQYRSDDSSLPSFIASGTPSYYNRMVDVLMTDQNGRCCYCLRRLQTGTPPSNADAKITIEHIIPCSFDHNRQADADEYRNFVGNMQNVELTDVFESKSGAQSMPPYPHSVAYDNMVVSCNGTFPAIREGGHANTQICCNHKRGVERVLPVYFLHDIADNVDYLKTGDVQANPSSLQCNEIDEVIQKTALGCDSLKDIRRIWYELSAIDMREIMQCDTEDKREAILNNAFSNTLALTKPIETARIVAKFKRQDYWDTLMLYDVFYDIMKAKYRTPAP